MHSVTASACRMFMCHICMSPLTPSSCPGWAPAAMQCAARRAFLGWMPAPERRHVELSDVQAGVGTSSSTGTAQSPSPAAAAGSGTAAGVGGGGGVSVTRDLVLWPYDRPESRGRLKALTIRLSETQLVVVAYKALPWWQVRPGSLRGWGKRARDACCVRACV